MSYHESRKMTSRMPRLAHLYYYYFICLLVVDFEFFFLVNCQLEIIFLIIWNKIGFYRSGFLHILSKHDMGDTIAPAYDYFYKRNIFKDKKGKYLVFWTAPDGK